MSDDNTKTLSFNFLGLVLFYAMTTAAFSGCIFAMRCAWEAGG